MPNQLDLYNAARDEWRAAWDATGAAIKELATLKASVDTLDDELAAVKQSSPFSIEHASKAKAHTAALEQVAPKEQQVADLRDALQDKDAELKAARAPIDAALLKGGTSSKKKKKRAAAASSSASKAEETQRKKARVEPPKGDDDEPVHDMLAHSAFAEFFEFTCYPQFSEVLARHNVHWMQKGKRTKKVPRQWITRGKTNASEIWRILEKWWVEGGHAGKNASIDVLLAKLLPAYEAGLTRDKAGSVYHEIAKILDPDVLTADGAPPALKSATIHAYHKLDRFATSFNKALYMWNYRLKALGEKDESEADAPGEEEEEAEEAEEADEDSSEEDSSSEGEDSELSEDDAEKDPSYRGRKK